MKFNIDDLIILKDGDSSIAYRVLSMFPAAWSNHDIVIGELRGKDVVRVLQSESRLFTVYDANMSEDLKEVLK